MKQYGILFDYNGVLVGDEHLHEQALAHIMEQYGCEMTHQLYEKYCLGRSDRDCFDNLKQVFPAIGKIETAKLVEQKVEEYRRKIQDQSIVYPDVKDVLQRLSEQFSLAVVTGSLRSEVGSVLEQAGIAKFFQAVVTADDIQRGKPDPEGYEKGIATLALPPEKIVVVEDTPNGIRAAQAAGLACIAVLHTASRENLSHADKIVKSIADITPELVMGLLVR